MLVSKKHSCYPTTISSMYTHPISINQRTNVGKCGIPVPYVSSPAYENVIEDCDDEHYSTESHDDEWQRERK